MRRIVFSATLIALAGGLLASLMLYPLTRSIHLLVDGVRRFGETFNPEDPASVDQRIEFRAFNEMADLRDSFNEMTATLKTTMLERKSLKEETGILRHQATTDALTGLYNKRQFEEDFPALVELSAARKRSLCLLMLDMDRFKLLNDTLGHAEGDRALKDLSQSIRERTRTTERAYRVGGDEFIVISVGTTMEDAVAISERIADHYDKCKAERETPPRSRSASWPTTATASRRSSCTRPTKRCTASETRQEEGATMIAPALCLLLAGAIAMTRSCPSCAR